MPDSAPHPGAHVLVAAEDAGETVTLARGLRRAGYRATEAYGLTQALDVARRHEPHLALLGLCAPTTWGMLLAERLALEHELPFVILAADGDPDHVARAGALGALGYLVKPLDISQIVPAVGAALARAAQITALIEKRHQLTQALETGREISMATGIVMERCGLDRQRAFETLRARARSERRRLDVIAAEMLDAVEKVNRLRPPQ